MNAVRRRSAASRPSSRPRPPLRTHTLAHPDQTRLARSDYTFYSEIAPGESRDLCELRLSCILKATWKATSNLDMHVANM